MDFFQLLEPYAVNIYGMVGHGTIKTCDMTAPTLRHNLEISMGHHTVIKVTPGIKMEPMQHWLKNQSRMNRLSS